jgi:hypothetical protein
VKQEDSMLSMHYRIALAGPDAVASVRRRVAERGPLFDGMDGLAHKFFLIDELQPTYATFYLWRDEAAARRFLEGPFFAHLVEHFGRPKVHLTLPQKIVLPAQEPSQAWLIHAEAEALPYAPQSPRIDTIDPERGTYLSLAFTGDWPGRRFEILYHARGPAALDRPLMSDAISFAII